MEPGGQLLGIAPAGVGTPDNPQTSHHTHSEDRAESHCDRVKELVGSLVVMVEALEDLLFSPSGPDSAGRDPWQCRDVVIGLHAAGRAPRPLIRGCLLLLTPYGLVRDSVRS